MSFDLSSAKPVSDDSSGGFDLSTAKPVSGNDTKAATPAPDSVTAPQKSAGQRLTGLAEGALSMATGALATPVSGLAGIASGGDPDVIKRTQEALTYAPRTEEGGKVLDVATKPFQWLGKAADWAGEKTADLASKLGASPEVAGGAGAAVNTGIQGVLPVAVGGALGRVAGKSAAAGETAARGAAAAKAEAAVKSVGIEWSKLGREARMRLADAAKDAKSFDKLDKAGIERVARAGSLPVPMNLTKGQATREPSQLRVEEQLGQTEAGAPIKETHMDQNAALQQNLDVLKGRTGSKSATAEDAGVSVDKALKRKEAQSNARINRLYNKARAAGETEQKIDIAPLLKHMADHPEPDMVGFVANKLKSLDATRGATKPEVEAMGRDVGKVVPTKDLSLNELEGIRKAAGVIARTDQSTKGHYAGQVIKVIDQMVPESAGGRLYKAARDARREHAMEFEEPKAISQLVDSKSRTDRKVALEDVFHKTVVSPASSIADLERVRDTLLKSTDRQTRNMGRKAWQDLAGQTVDYIKREATDTAVNDQRGNPSLSPAGLRKAIERIGDRKLETLLGKTVTQKLRDIAATASDVKTMPPFKGGSTTTVNAMTLLDRVLDSAKDLGGKLSHVPVVGPVARGAVQTLQELHAKGARQARVNEAVGAQAKQKQRPNWTLRGLLGGSKLIPGQRQQ